MSGGNITNLDGLRGILNMAGGGGSEEGEQIIPIDRFNIKYNTKVGSNVESSGPGDLKLPVAINPNLTRIKLDGEASDSADSQASQEQDEIPLPSGRQDVRTSGPSGPSVPTGLSQNYRMIILVTMMIILVKMEVIQMKKK